AVTARQPYSSDSTLHTPAAFSIGAPLFPQLFERRWLEPALWEVQDGVASFQVLRQSVASFGGFGLCVVRVHLVAHAVVGDAGLPAVGGRDVQDPDVAVVLTRWAAFVTLGLLPVLAQLVRRDELTAQLPWRGRCQRALWEVQDGLVAEHEASETIAGFCCFFCGGVVADLDALTVVRTAGCPRVTRRHVGQADVAARVTRVLTIDDLSFASQLFRRCGAASFGLFRYLEFSWIAQVEDGPIARDGSCLRRAR